MLFGLLPRSRTRHPTQRRCSWCICFYWMQSDYYFLSARPIIDLFVRSAPCRRSHLRWYDSMISKYRLSRLSTTFASQEDPSVSGWGLSMWQSVYLQKCFPRSFFISYIFLNSDSVGTRTSPNGKIFTLNFVFPRLLGVLTSVLPPNLVSKLMFHLSSRQI